MKNLDWQHVVLFLGVIALAVFAIWRQPNLVTGIMSGSNVALLIGALFKQQLGGADAPKS